MADHAAYCTKSTAIQKRGSVTRGTQCFAVNCTNYQTVHFRSLGVSFHKFPNIDKDPVRYAEWKRNCLRTVPPSRRALICSSHFEKSCFDRTGQIVRLRERAVPTIFVQHENLQVKKKPCSTEVAKQKGEPLVTLKNVKRKRIESTAQTLVKKKPASTETAKQEGEPLVIPNNINKKRTASTAQTLVKKKPCSTETAKQKCEPLVFPNNVKKKRTESTPQTLVKKKLCSKETAKREPLVIPNNAKRKRIESTAQTLDHKCSSSELEAMKHQLQLFRDRVGSLERKLKSATARAKRANETCQNLTAKIKEQNLLNAELEKKLKQYKDVPSQ